MSNGWKKYDTLPEELGFYLTFAPIEGFRQEFFNGETWDTRKYFCYWRNLSFPNKSSKEAFEIANYTTEFDLDYFLSITQRQKHREDI